MPDTFAYIALFSWPFVVFILFRRLPRADAVIWSILGGYLLLPFAVGIKIPMVPTFDKTLIPALSAGLICLIAADRIPPRRRRRLSSLGRNAGAAVPKALEVGPVPTAGKENIHTRRRKFGKNQLTAVVVSGRRWDARFLNLLIFLLCVAPFITVLQNGEPVFIGKTTLPALRIYDAFSIISGELVGLLPFFLGRRYLAGDREQTVLLRILCVAGLYYTLPTLFEIRMSPQLSKWIYGFLAQPFDQSMRDGGFRPTVFLQQGLWLAIFMTMAALAGFSLWRHEWALGRKTRWIIAGVYISAVLFFCHSLGALLILIAFIPVVLVAHGRSQFILASIVAASFVTYPVLRGTGLVPVDEIYKMVKSSISVERADSFDFRLKNEDKLLARANQKPLAGWGGWGRGRVYNSQGRDISITDGIWIIVIGDSGWLGYVSTFGLLTAPILLLTLRRRELNLSFATAGLCLILAANLIDMITNATLTPVTWLVAGALAGRLGVPSVEMESMDVGNEPPRRMLNRSNRSRGGEFFPQSADR